MKCMQPDVRLPVDFEGEHVGIMVSRIDGKVWVCIDGQSVLRARKLTSISVDHVDGELHNLTEEQEFFLRAIYQLGPLRPPKDTAIDALTALLEGGYITNTMVGGESGFVASTGKGMAYVVNNIEV